MEGGGNTNLFSVRIALACVVCLLQIDSLAFSMKTYNTFYEFVRANWAQANDSAVACDKERYETLAEHDKHFHKSHYTGGACSFRQRMKQEGNEDRVVMSSSFEEAKSGSYRARRNKMSKNLEPYGTYDLKTGEPLSFTTGYQVSFQEEATERPLNGQFLTDKQYDRKVRSICRAYHVSPCLGTFGEPEISFHVRTLEEAMQIARANNQESVFDWAEKKLNKACVRNKDMIGQVHYRDIQNHTDDYKSHMERKNRNGNRN